MKTQPLLLAALALVSFSAAAAVQPLTRDEAQKATLQLNNALGEVKDGPFRLELDALKPHGVKGDGRAGAIAVPVHDLKNRLSRARPGVIIPVGQLWLHKLVPAVNGSPAAGDTLRTVVVKSDDGESTATLLYLGFRKERGKAELLLYGQGDRVLLTLPLKSMDVPQAHPIELDAQRAGDDKAELILYLGDSFEGRLELRPEAAQ